MIMQGAAFANDGVTVLDPALEICDPHHHLWQQDPRQGHSSGQYLVPRFLAELGGGHRVTSRPARAIKHAARGLDCMIISLHADGTTGRDIQQLEGRTIGSPLSPQGDEKIPHAVAKEDTASRVLRSRM